VSPHARSGGADPADRPAKADAFPPVAQAVFTAFDLETTGLVPGVDRIVEIGAVRFGLHGEVSAFEALVDPEMPISEGAQRVNGITPDMLAGKPKIPEVLPDFFRFIEGSYPVAHNAPFDAGFVYAAAALHGITAPDFPVLDTRALAEAAFPRRGSYGLAALKRSFSIGSPTSHRALADAEACRALFLLCVGRLAETEDAGLERLLRLSGPALSMASRPPADVGRIAELSGFLRAGRTVEIVYVGGTGEETVRRVTPLSFCTLGGSPALEAFCHLRQEKRTFKVSSILSIRPV
jgi:DNA polymerase-3 subunit epsilon